MDYPLWLISFLISLYRVTQQVTDLGWVEFDFGFSTVCPILLGLMRDRQRGQGSGQDEWKIQIIVNPVRDLLGQRHPVN